MGTVQSGRTFLDLSGKGKKQFLSFLLMQFVLSNYESEKEIVRAGFVFQKFTAPKLGNSVQFSRGWVY